MSLHIKKTFTRLGASVMALGIILSLIPSVGVSAATASSADVREAQTIIDKFGIPVGPIDGLNGPNTAQGLCAFRWISGMAPSRAPLDAATLAKLRDYNTRYADGHATPKKYLTNGAKTYMVVEQTCQTMFFFYDGTWWATFPVSTGRPGLTTPNGYYTIGSTVKGWSCSTEYPETCRSQSGGKDVGFSNYGNMYNKRAFKSGGFYVHGSNTVPTYPDSAGCIRMTTADMDWISGVVPDKTGLLVTGKFTKMSTDRFAYTATRTLK